MSNPWELNSSLIIADEDPRDTYAAVGHSLSEWEGVEIGLCRIFSFFVGDPDGEAMRTYGEPRIFRERFGKLLQAADQFFISHNNQELEGTLHQLEGEITGYADRRNEIAHGIVMPINAFSFASQIIPKMKPRTNYWALMPSYYQVRKHNQDGFPEFIYGASSMVTIADGMTKLYGKISEYREKLRSVLGQIGQC
ncbi:MAG: hypothetical protein ACKVP5_06420 [Aestuariivirga sp.]